MATAQAVNIQRRARDGIGLDDAPMPAYSQAYARLKQKSGREAAIRNLSWSGSMLRAIALERVEVESTGPVAVLGFSTQKQEEIARYNQQRTPWFGISRQDAAILQRIAERRLAAAVNKRNRGAL